MQAGSGLTGDEIAEVGLYPVYGGNGHRGYTSRYTHEGRFVLIGRQGALCGNIAVARGRFYATEHAIVCTPLRPVNAGWLARYLERMNLNRFSEASAQPGLSVQKISYKQIALPPFEEQSSMAAVLENADEAIAKTEAVMAKLRQVRTGLIHDLLTCGLDENGHLRDPIAHPEQFQDTRLGQSPLSWQVTPLSLLCAHIGSGVTPKGGQNVYKSTGILFIRSQNVAFERLLLDDVAFITPETHVGMLRSEIFAHDVLYNITGASIGRCCPMPEGLGVANVNQHVCALRVPSASAADAKFLATFLSSSICQRQLDALLTVGNRQGLNYQQLGSFIVPWPDAPERERISEQLWATDSSVTKAEHELAKLRLIKSGLMDDLLTGRVRVPETRQTCHPSSSIA